MEITSNKTASIMIPQPKGLHPKYFKLGWGFSNAKLAMLLAKSERTISAYFCRPKTITYRKASKSVMQSCYLLHLYFLSEGYTPVNPQLIQENIIELDW